MDPSALLAPEYVSLWLAGTTMVALATWIFLLDVSNVAQRVFALLIGLRGVTLFIGPLRVESGSVQASVAWASVAPYLIIAIVPLVLAFLSLYPKRRGLGRSRLAMGLLLAVTLGLEAWYFVDHAAYARIVPAVPAGYADYGPLFIFTGLRLPALALTGFILAGDYRRDPEGSAGFSQFLMVAGFTLNGLFDGTLAALELRDVLASPPADWMPWVWTRWWLPVLALPISIATCLRLLPVLRLARANAELQEVTRFFAFAVPVALASPFLIDLPVAAAENITLFTLAIWRMAIPLLLTYALLRHQLFDIDIRLKDGVRRGIILGAFTITFFLVAEAAESLVQGDRGPIFGVAGAGLLALASRPLQGFASRTADSLMPDTKPIAQQTYAERLRFYLDQFRLVAYDGDVTDKERRMLDRLRRTLALSPEAAADLEARGTLPDAGTLAAARVHADESTRDTRLEVAIKGTLAASVMALVFGMLSQGIESIIPLSNQVAGLIAAAVVALSLGPIEGLADRLTHRIDPSKATDAKDEAERRQAFRAALTTALEDGSLSERDLHYLAGLQKRLRIPWATRWRIERQVRRSVGL